MNKRVREKNNITHPARSEEEDKHNANTEMQTGISISFNGATANASSGSCAAGVVASRDAV